MGCILTRLEVYTIDISEYEKANRDLTNSILTKEKHNKREVYCICREEERPGMIGCDYCDEWYHTQCLSLNKDEVKRLANENWSCPNCEFKRGKNFNLDHLNPLKKINLSSC